MRREEGFTGYIERAGRIKLGNKKNPII